MSHAGHIAPSHPTARTNEWTAVAYTRIPERAAVFDSIQREFRNGGRDEGGENVCVRARAHARAIVYFTFCVYRRGLALAAAPAMARRPKLLAPGSRFGCLELGGCLWVRARSDCILTSRCMYARMSVFVVTCSNTLSTLTQRRWGVGVKHDVYIRIFTCNRVRSIRAPAGVGRGIASYEACRIRLAPC